MARGGFPSGMGGNMQQMMRQAQKMQQDIANLQQELNAREVEAQSGGGMVRIVAYGSKELKSIEINPEVMDADDVEMLQDLILAAANEAIRKADDMVKEAMSAVTGGLDLGF